MSLGSLVETLIGSEPFERLLVARERPVLAQAETGDAFVAASQGGVSGRTSRRSGRRRLFSRSRRAPSDDCESNGSRPATAS